MFRKNKRSQQPLLISNVQELPTRSLKILQGSWAATFREEVFMRIPEERFGVLYVSFPSRPNVPVNVLMGLEILKGWFGWSDEELYAHFLFDLQVRYALGCDNFGEGDFDLRTLYYFRRAVSEYALKEKINLIQVTYADITDQQLKKFEVKTGMQRMDSTDIASNIADLSRLELLITVVQRLYRVLSSEDQERFSEPFAPYIKTGAGQYTYRIKGKEAVWAEIQRVGEVFYPLLQQLRAGYEQEAIYATAQRFFDENFTLSQEQVKARPNHEISPGCLQSVDDVEASYRVKGSHAHRGYVANLSETCDPTNPVQLITQVSVAPNRTSDQELLKRDVPAIQARMELKHLVNDGEYTGPSVDDLLRKAHVQQSLTALTGTLPDRSEGKQVMADFAMQLDEQGNVTAATCPAGHPATIYPSPKGQSFRLCFAPSTCLNCPFFQQQQCPVKLRKDQTAYQLNVPKERAASSQRRRRFEQTKEQARALRPAVEATMFQVTCHMPGDKVPVRGRFRVTMVVLCSALMVNARRIDRYLKDKQRGKFTKKYRHTGVSSPRPSFFQAFANLFCRPFSRFHPFAFC
jgi:hypothetical protein